MRAIIEPEYGAPDGTTRRVQILTPADPLAAISIDKPNVDVAGPGRYYKLAQLPPETSITIHLQPSQSIYAAVVASGGGMVELSVIIEYLDVEE